MTIKEAAKVLEDKYMTMQGVYGVNIVPCKKCGGDYIEVMMDTHNRSLMTSIPSSIYGFRVEKIHQDKPIETQYETQIFAPTYAYPYLYGGIYGMPYWGRPRVIGGGHPRPRPHFGGGFRRR